MTWDQVNTLWFQGPHHVRETIINSIAHYLPNIHAQMAAQWGLSSVDFPYIDKFDANEPLGGMRAISAYVTMNLPQASGITVVDIDDSIAEAFRTTYSCRVYTFVKTGAGTDIDGDVDEAAYSRINRLRDMNAAAIRAAILFDASFNAPDMELQHATLSEQYSDIQKAKGDRWIAALYHEFDVKVDESVVRPIIGNANTIDVTVQLEDGNS